MTDKITIERETLQEAVYAMENATMYDDADFAALDALKGALRAALAAQPAPAAVPLTDEQIKDALLQYRCAHFQDEDGGLPLTDALAHAFGDTDITRAKHEIEMIVDAIAAAAAGDKP